jgi:hypothetical protein
MTTKKFRVNKKKPKKYKTRKCKSRLKKTNSRKKIGSGLGDVIYKYTLGEKSKEIIPQAKSIYEGYIQGYGVGGIGGWTDFAWENGRDEQLLTMRLSDIMLWHPVRGSGEREQAGRKTTSRAESTYNVLMNSMSEVKNPEIQTVTFSRKRPLTSEEMNKIPEMSSDDGIKVCPININNTESEADQAEIDRLTQSITDLDESLKTATNSNSIRAIKGLKETNSDLLQNLLYKNETYKQIFLVLSGQGRLQALIEAVRKANIPPDTFFIQLSCKSVFLDICNVLIKIHNSWVKRGDFNDERHEIYINGNYTPMDELKLAFSCSKNRSRLDTQCYSNYKTGNTTSDNMGCANVYDYSSRIPLSRFLSK